MNNIKIKSKFSVIIFLILFSCSDDFLDVPVEFTDTVENFYENDSDMLLALSAAYSSLGDINLYSRDYYLQKGLLTNDAFSGESGPGFSENYQFNFNPIIQDTRNIWHALYEGIFRCNNVLVNNPSETSNAALIARIKDEARFLRALYYWHLWSGWRDMPLRTTENMLIPAIAKSPRDEIFNFMVADLQTVIENNNLPYKYTGAVNQEAQRATMGAAKALLGRIYLYTENWDLAAGLLDEVANRSEYRLMEDFNAVWNFQFEGNNNSEVLFAAVFSTETGYGVNPFFSDGFGAAEGTLRSLYIYITTFYNLIPTPDLLNSYNGEPNDSRRAATIIRRNDTIPWSEPNNPLIYLRNEISIVKGISEDPTKFTNQNNEDFPIIRLADVYLMLAEALHMGSGSDAEAMEWIDLVRERAFGPSFVSTADRMSATGKDLMTVIKEERRKELAYEALRYNDLRRWGDLDKIVDLNGNPRFVQGHEFWPIPQGDIARTGGLLEQDPNY